MVGRVVVAGLEIIEAGFGIVVVATVTQRIDFGHCAGGGQDVAGGIVGVGVDCRGGRGCGCAGVSVIRLRKKLIPTVVSVGHKPAVLAGALINAGN